MPSLHRTRHLYVLVLFISPFGAAKGFSTTMRSASHRSAATAHPAFVSSASAATAEGSKEMSPSTSKPKQYEWTKPTLELAIPALVASIAGKFGFPGVSS